MSTRNSSSIEEAITLANSLLPGVAVAEGETDPRWQAIIEVGEYISTEPERVWEFVTQWGSHEDSDLRSAVATCLLEHLLADHFDLIFPRLEDGVTSNDRFADTFRRCWKFGQAELPANSSRFDALQSRRR